MFDRLRDQKSIPYAESLPHQSNSALEITPAISSVPYLKKHASDVYYVHWTQKRIGMRVSTRTRNLAEAKKLFAKWLLRDDEPGGVRPIRELWCVYFEKHVRKNVTAQSTLAVAWANLKPYFGSRLISQVTQDSVDEYVELRTSGRLGRRVKPQTCRKELAYLIACLKFCAAAPQKLIPASAIDKIKLPADGEARDRWLTSDEIKKLLAVAREMRRGKRISRVERFLWLALNTAGRKQAILDLTWDRVDFETNVIHFDVPGRRKTKKRRASVPISDSLRPILERAYAEREGDLVMDNGGAMWATLQRVAIKAGIGGKQRKVPAGTKPKATGISPHVLRHTAATHMARRGVPIWKIAKFLGNSVLVTERSYAHHNPDDLRDAVNAVAEGWEGGGR